MPKRSMRMDPPAVTVLQALHGRQSLTRRGLSDHTGLSVGLVNAQVSHLLALQLLCEDVVQGGTPGRPAGLLSIHPGAGRVVGVDVGGASSRAVVSDATGRVVASMTHETQAVPDRRIILGSITRLLEAACQQVATRPGELAALGVAVSGLVDPHTGTVFDWPNTPEWAAGWAGLNLPAELGNLLGIQPIIVDDTVRARALRAYRMGPAQGRQNFLYVELGGGVGSGVFINGRPYPGSKGMAGELGHVTIDESGPWCACGNRGCLEAIASRSAVLRRVREYLADTQRVSALRETCDRGELTLASLIQAAEGGDKLAFQVLDETGGYVGKVLAFALNMLNPEMVVLAGALTQDGGILLEAVQRQIRRHALSHIWKQVRIVCDPSDELAGAHGAALLALDALFTSPKHLAHLLSRAG